LPGGKRSLSHLTSDSPKNKTKKNLTNPGKSDSESETPFQTARREANEEIGLPGISQPLPAPFSVEHLCEIPSSLARTELVVRPCVALLHTYDEQTGQNADPETSLIPRLDAREVAAVFTAPFRDFLQVLGDPRAGDPEEWYQGAWTEWYGTGWRSTYNRLISSTKHKY
jgi:8-oxo-dGTP pyrophosphatase MutT (NUDIX family)